MRFKDNASHLLSTKTLNKDSLRKILKASNNIYQLKIKNGEINKDTTFKSYLLDNWGNDKKYKGGRKRIRKIEISVERFVYNSTTVKQFKHFLTAQEQKLFKKRLSEMLKSIYRWIL